MYSFLALIHGSNRFEGVADDLRALGANVAPTLEGSFNGGDLIALFDFVDETGWRDAKPEIEAILSDDRVARADTAFYRHGQLRRGEIDGGSRIYRVLLLCADKPQDDTMRARFDAEMVQMPRYIDSIRNWRYSPVLEAGGEREWTHVWEQEYDDVGGLLGPYMMHPYHWARIDRWFDPECSEWMVDVRLCHSFGAFDGPVIA